MRFTQYTDYSFRVLTYIGLMPEGELATIRDIAGRYGISENHLMKVVHRLGLHGFIETVRGRQGGIRLARPPEEINLGAVVRKCEEDLRLVECFDAATNTCRIARACALSGILDEALMAFLSVLDRRTLADLLQSPADLRAILFPAEELAESAS